MKIVTYGPSPYLNTTKGKVHADVIEYFNEQGDDVCTIAFDYDSSYFMPEDGRHIYQSKDVRQFVEPINKKTKDSSKRVYDFIKYHKPDVVLTIGDYFETDEVNEAKGACPSDFKWVGIIMSRSTPIEKKYSEVLDNMDAIVVTNETVGDCVKHLSKTEIHVGNAGYKASVYGDESEEPFAHPGKMKRFIVGANLKNAQSNNICCFLSTISILRMRGVDCYGSLHYNQDDEGDYDVKEIAYMYGIENYIIIPHEYISVQEGPPDLDMRRFYSTLDVYFDPSVYSTNATSLIEASMCGAVPVCGRFGAFKDVGWSEGFVDSSNFIGDRSQNMRFVSDIYAASVIEKIHDKMRPDELDHESRNKKWLFEQSFSTYQKGLIGKTREVFITGVRNFCKKVAERKRTKLAVESLS